MKSFTTYVVTRYCRRYKMGEDEVGETYSTRGKISTQNSDYRIFGETPPPSVGKPCDNTDTINVTWLITLGWRVKPTMGIRNFNLQDSKVRRRWKIGLNQRLIYIHPFPSTLSPVFYLTLFNSIVKKELFLSRKMY